MIDSIRDNIALSSKVLSYVIIAFFIPLMLVSYWFFSVLEPQLKNQAMENLQLHLENKLLLLSPILSKNKLDEVLQYQSPEVKKILNDYRGGETGETLLVEKIAPAKWGIHHSRLDKTSHLNFQNEQLDLLPSEVVDLIEHQDHGNKHSYDKLGHPIMLAWTVSSDHNWGIIVKINIAEVLSESNRARTLFFIFAMINFLLICYLLLSYLKHHDNFLKQLCAQVLKAVEHSEKPSHDIELASSTAPLEFKSLISSIEKLIAEKNLLQDLRSRAYKETQNVNKELQRVLEFANEGIVTIDEQQTILFFNKAAERIFGYQLEEVIGEKLAILLPQEIVSFHQHIVASYRMAPEDIKDISSQGRKLEIKTTNKQGQALELAISISCIQLADNSWRFSAFIRDIGKEKEIEHYLIESKEKAEEANREKSEFISIMSHELRTPMHGILSYARLGINRINNVSLATKLRYFRNIELSGKRLLCLVNDLLELSHMESGQYNLSIGKHSLHELIQACVEEMAATMEERDIKIALDLAEKEQKIDCDIAKIHLVVSNLLSNAIKFSPDNSTISIALTYPNTEQVLLSIFDQGKGVDALESKQIFEKFKQGHYKPVDKEMASSGLGLAICKKIIELHHGNIWVRTNDASYTGGRFFVSLALDKMA